MKKLFTVALVLLASVSLAVAQSTTPTQTNSKKASEPEKVPTAKEASYAIGVYFGSMISENLKHAPGGNELNKAVLMQGLEEAMNNKASITPEKAYEQVGLYLQAKQKEKDEANKKASEEFMAKNAKKEGVITTKSGLQYMIIEEGKGPKATVEDTVTVNYKGQLIDGTVFDSSYDRGEPTKFNPMQVIPGWTEGLCLLPEGTKARLFIPYNLAYGERGIGDKIPPYSTLIFDIDLIKVTKGKPIPFAKSEAPAKETTLEHNKSKK